MLALALLAGGIAVVRDDDAGEGDGELVPLALGAGGTLATASPEAGASADMAMMVAPYEYLLAGELPDLGGTAPVYRFALPAMDATRAAELAAALGVGGSPTPIEGGWVVEDGMAYLTVTEMPGAWAVSFGQGTSGYGVDDAVPGDAGYGVDDAVAEPVTVEDVPVTDPEPVDLPSRDEAEQMARDTLGAMGVLEGADWEVEVVEGGIMGMAVSCVQPADGSDGCAEDVSSEVVLSWSVTFHRVVDGLVTSGLEWSVDVGDGAR